MWGLSLVMFASPHDVRAKWRVYLGVMTWDSFFVLGFCCVGRFVGGDVFCWEEHSVHMTSRKPRMHPTRIISDATTSFSFTCVQNVSSIVTE